MGYCGRIIGSVSWSGVVINAIVMIIVTITAIGSIVIFMTQ